MVGRGQTEEDALEDAKAALELSPQVDDAGGGQGHSPCPFDALEAEQGVKPADNVDDLRGGFWPKTKARTTS